MYRVPSSAHLCWHIFTVLLISQPSGGEVVSHVIWTCTSLTEKEVEHLLIDHLSFLSSFKAAQVSTIIKQ